MKNTLELLKKFDLESLKKAEDDKQLGIAPPEKLVEQAIKFQNELVKDYQFAVQTSSLDPLAAADQLIRALFESAKCDFSNFNAESAAKIESIYSILPDELAGNENGLQLTEVAQGMKSINAWGLEKTKEQITLNYIHQIIEKLKTKHVVGFINTCADAGMFFNENETNVGNEMLAKCRELPLPDLTMLKLFLEVKSQFNQDAIRETPVLNVLFKGINSFIMLVGAIKIEGLLENLDPVDESLIPTYMNAMLNSLNRIMDKQLNRLIQDLNIYRTQQSQLVNEVQSTTSSNVKFSLLNTLGMQQNESAIAKETISMINHLIAALGDPKFLDILSEKDLTLMRNDTTLKEILSKHREILPEVVKNAIAPRKRDKLKQAVQSMLTRKK